MAQAGFTPLIHFNSGTTGHVPTTANLAVGELAINYTDGKIFYNNGAGSILQYSPPAVVLAATSGTINGVVIGGTTPAAATFTTATATTFVGALTGSASLNLLLTGGSLTGALTSSSTISATSFSGAGTGLTGTAASLNIGGNAATATSATNATNATNSTTQAVNTSNTTIATTAFANPANSQSTNGYCKFPSGVIIQWGVFATSAAGYTNISMPLAFPTKCASITGSLDQSSNATYCMPSFDLTATRTSTVPCALLTTGGAYAAASVSWVAMGY